MTTRIRDLRAWMGVHPEVPDGTVAALLIALTVLRVTQGHRVAGHEYTPPDATGYGVSIAMTASLTLRRRFPLAVLTLIAAGELFIALAGYQPSGEFMAFLIAVYSVAAHRPLARSILAGAAAMAVLTGAVVADQAGFFSAITTLCLFAVVWWLGRGLRLRRSYLAELEDRAARLEKARFADARAARVEERSRIARELHDVVAHHVSVMTVQAAAARRIIDRDPQKAKEAIETIEQIGRTALSEMRRIVGVLRTDRDLDQPAAELSPQPGTEDLSRLIEQVRETGLAVQLQVDGEPCKLSTGVDLAVYRLIQEALTNSLKHAGPHARAWVHLKYTDRDLTLDIVDDGRGATTALCSIDSPGHGLVGMRERVALYGGEVRIGPRVGGGFEVRARFPLEVT